MVEAGAGKLPGDLQVALGVGAAGDRLLEVVGGDEGGGGLEVDRVGQLGLDLPAQGANRISRWADSAAASSSGAKARGTSP